MIERPAPAPPSRRHITAWVAAYIVLSLPWMWYSEYWADRLIVDSLTSKMVSTSSEWLFVLATAALLYTALMRMLRRQQEMAARELDVLRRESRTAAQLRALAESSPDAIFVKDTAGRYLLFNPAAERITGIAAATALGRSDAELFPPDGAGTFASHDDEVLRGAASRTFEDEADTAIGRRIFAATKGPLRDADGRVIGLFGVARDVTETARAHRQLEEGERRYRQLFAANPQPMWVADGETLHILAVNDAAVRHYGFGRDEFLAMALPDLHPGAERAALGRAVTGAGAAAHRRRGAWSHFCRDGRTIEVEIDINEIEFDGRPARLVQALDVTERLRLEREREAAHRMLADVLGRVTDAFAALDNDGRLVYANAQAATMWGQASTAGLLGRALWDTVPAVEDGALRAAYERAVAAGEPVVAEVRHSVSGRWIEYRIHPSPQGVSLYFSDITPRRDARAALRQREQALVASQSALSELSQRLLDQERSTTRRLAQALHDRLGQILGSARLHLDLALETSGSGARPLARASTLLDDAVAEVRRVLVELRPPLLESQGLAASLDNELRDSAAAGLGVAAELKTAADVAGRRWPEAVEYAAFMIAREAIANALHHARANRLEVVLDGGPRRLELLIRDDGVGIGDAEMLGRPGHLGIVGMRERALAIGARLQVARAGGGGTLVGLNWTDLP